MIGDETMTAQHMDAVIAAQHRGGETLTVGLCHIREHRRAPVDVPRAPPQRHASGIDRDRHVGDL